MTKDHAVVRIPYGSDRPVFRHCASVPATSEEKTALLKWRD